MTLVLGDPLLNYSSRQYGDNVLQNVGVWQFANEAHKPGEGHWIVFIHGGAWRDPKINHLTFIPSINHLVSSTRLPRDAIAGFASIDYRLSPHPDHPQDPTSTPSSTLRVARHPDHLRDVQSALKLLKEQFGMSDKYILIGHSAGATLAFQLLMDQASQDTQSPTMPLPAAIIGISGIYDLVGLDERHGGNYAGFITSAFGDEKKAWKAASPSEFLGDYKKSWPSGKFALLAWSNDDTLIDEPEIDSMATKLIKDRVNISITKDLHGEHDFVWEDGAQVARLVLLTLAQLHEST